MVDSEESDYSGKSGESGDSAESCDSGLSGVFCDSLGSGDLTILRPPVEIFLICFYTPKTLEGQVHEGPIHVIFVVVETFQKNNLHFVDRWQGESDQCVTCISYWERGKICGEHFLGLFGRDGIF